MALPSLCVYVWVQISAFYKDTSHVGPRPPQCPQCKISSVKTLSANKVTFRGIGALGLGHKSTHDSKEGYSAFSS